MLPQQLAAHSKLYIYRGFSRPLFFMATPTYATSSELDAVNSILMSVGESPVNTLNTQSPEVAIAQKTLQQVVREVQAEGWVFNTEYEVEFTPDSNDQVALSDSVLQIDLSRYKHNDNYDVIKKGGYLYDRYTHSKVFADEATVYADVVWMYAFEDMPQPFKDYCTARATRIAHTRMVNDGQMAPVFQQDETVSRALALEYDTRQADYNVFQNARARNPYNAYKPYQVIGR